MELNNLKQEANKLRMTPQEKSAIQARIFGVASPMAPVPGPYFSYSFQFIHAKVLVPLAVVIVVFGGAGTAAAAQGALPGDMLYPVKVSINEAVEVALATTPVAKAEVSAKLAERRAEEAEALSARGTLTPETGEALAVSIETHVKAAQESADIVAVEDPATADNLRAKLDTSLSAHGAILATLSGGSIQNEEGTNTVVVRVLATAAGNAAPTAVRMAKTESAAQTMSMMVATDTAEGADQAVSLEGDMIDGRVMNADVIAASAKLQARATAALASARKEFEENKESLDAATITEVSGKFAIAAEYIQEGDGAAAADNFGGAARAYTDALKLSLKLQILLRAQERLERNVILPVLEKDVLQVETDAKGNFDLFRTE